MSAIAGNLNALFSPASTSILVVVLPVIVALAVAIVFVGTSHVFVDNISTSI
jgi:hypothetical protein